MRWAIPAFALSATLLLHAFAISLALQFVGEDDQLPTPSPLRVEMLPAPVVAPPVLPIPSTSRPAAPTPRSKSIPQTAEPAPIVSPRPDGVPYTSVPLAVLGDEFAMPAPEAGEAASQTFSTARTMEAEPAADQEVNGTQGHSTPPDSAAAALQSSLEAAPQSLEGRWRYRVYYGDFTANNQVATLDYVMAIEKGRYRLHTEGQAVGLAGLLYRGVFTQESQGAFSAAGFIPAQYSEQRGDRPVRAVRIEPFPDSVRVAFDDGRTEIASVLAQDRLTLAAQLAWLAANQSPALREAEIALPLIGVSSLRTLRFRITQQQMLETPSGVMQLTRLRSEDGDGGGDGSVEIWVSEFGDLMPIRIRLEDRRGQVLDQLISNR
jgi:hypothetical protein